MPSQKQQHEIFFSRKSTLYTHFLTLLDVDIDAVCIALRGKHVAVTTTLHHWHAEMKKWAFMISMNNSLHALYWSYPHYNPKRPMITWGLVTFGNNSSSRLPWNAIEQLPPLACAQSHPCAGQRWTPGLAAAPGHGTYLRRAAHFSIYRYNYITTVSYNGDEYKTRQ